MLEFDHAALKPVAFKTAITPRQAASLSKAAIRTFPPFAVVREFFPKIPSRGNVFQHFERFIWTGLAGSFKTSAKHRFGVLKLFTKDEVKQQWRMTESLQRS